MANMSASILRNIVASTFKVDAKTIRLSGELSPEKSWENESHDGSMGSNEDTFEIFGFSTTKGFMSLDIVGEVSGSNYAYSSSTYVEGTKLHEVPQIEEYMFIVVRNSGYTSWEGSRSDKWDTLSIHKLPNFLPYWEKLKEEDIARWEQWIES